MRKGYYKMLTDFNVYNSAKMLNGSYEYAPQGAVQNNYVESITIDGETLTYEQMLKDSLDETAINEENLDRYTGEIVEEVVAEYKENNPRTRYSLQDSKGRELSEGQKEYFRD